MHIDASEAIKALGITHPVKFVEKRLSDDRRTLARVNENDPSEIWLDLDAMREVHSNPEFRGTIFDNPEGTIAHELYHVMQFQRYPSIEAANDDKARASIEALFEGQQYDRLEREAYEHETQLAPLVKILP